MSVSYLPNANVRHYSVRYSLAILAWICNACFILFLLLAGPSENLLWFALTAQALSSICYIADPNIGLYKELRCVSAFHFVYQGFFLMRPLYIIAESEYNTIGSILDPYVSDETVFHSILYSAIGLMFFQLGMLTYSLSTQSQKIKNIGRRTLLSYKDYKISERGIIFLLGLEAILLFLSAYMNFLLHQSSLARFLRGQTAYIYMLPIVGSGISSSIAVLVSCSRNRGIILKFLFFALHIFYQLSIKRFFHFRIDYMSGAIIAVLSIFHIFRGRQVSGILLFSTVILLLPWIRSLGSAEIDTASFTTGAVTDLISKHFLNVSLKDYWTFFNAYGDFNIFDTFVSAVQSVQDFHPDKSYILPWFYLLVHWIPRQIWPDKPINGILYNQDFLDGLPFSPGIVGSFFLEGGFFWMLLCMFTLGLVISHIDSYILKIRIPEHKAYSYAVALVMVSFLVRSQLYPPFYYAVYFLMSRYLIKVIARNLRIITTCTRSRSY